MKPFLAAAIQLDSGSCIEDNLRQAGALLDEAAARGAQVAALPEYLHFVGPDRAEAVPDGQTGHFLSGKARQHGMWILGGTIFEKNPGGLPWNTSLLFAPDGSLAAAYRKLHLCDIIIPGGITTQESARMVHGHRPATADAGELGKFGLTICYDVRFPELFRLLALEGVHTFFVPADFGIKTGRAHRSLLLRARAVENGCYIIAPQQCGQSSAEGLSCGQSMIIDPWGDVLAQLDDGPGVITATIDPNRCLQLRQQLGMFENRRTDLYQIGWQPTK